MPRLNYWDDALVRLDDWIEREDPRLYEDDAPEDLAAMLFNSLWDSDVYNSDIEHFQRTPERFVKALRDLTESEEVNLTTFPNEPVVDEMVVIDNINFFSLCAHHVLPFYGMAHVAYIPKKNLLGLSKIPRVVRETAKGLHTQEVLTHTIAHLLEDALTVKDIGPVGVAVIMKARHLCMEMRGVREIGSHTTTSCMRGAFLDPTKHAREEFMELINGH